MRLGKNPSARRHDLRHQHIPEHAREFDAQVREVGDRVHDAQ